MELASSTSRCSGAGQGRAGWAQGAGAGLGQVAPGASNTARAQQIMDMRRGENFSHSMPGLSHLLHVAADALLVGGEQRRAVGPDVPVHLAPPKQIACQDVQQSGLACTSAQRTQLQLAASACMCLCAHSVGLSGWDRRAPTLPAPEAPMIASTRPLRQAPEMPCTRRQQQARRSGALRGLEQLRAARRRRLCACRVHPQPQRRPAWRMCSCSALPPRPFNTTV